MFGQGSTIRKRRLWDSGAAVKAYALARRAAERVGLQIVLKTYYSPIPDLSTDHPGCAVWQGSRIRCGGSRSSSTHRLSAYRAGCPA